MLFTSLQPEIYSVVDFVYALGAKTQLAILFIYVAVLLKKLYDFPNVFLNVYVVKLKMFLIHYLILLLSSSLLSTL